MIESFKVRPDFAPFIRYSMRERTARTDNTIQSFSYEQEKLQQKIAELEKLEAKAHQKIKALKKIAEKYKFLVETSSDMIFTVDLEGNFLFTNRAFKKSLGYSVREIKKINGFSLVHPEDLSKVKEQFAQLLEGKNVENMEYRYKTKNGSYIHVLNDAAPVFDSQGNVIAAFGVARDNTQRKMMEKELQEANEKLEQRVDQRTKELLILNEQLAREIIMYKESQEALHKSEEKYRVLVENAMDGIYIISPDGFEYVNPAFEKIFGYEEKEVCDKKFNFFDLIHPEDRLLIAKREEARKKGDKIPTLYSFRAITKEGELKHVEVDTIPLQGEKVRILGVLRDITKRKEAEEQLKNALKENEILLRELHHRVKNNMQIISSLLRLQARNIKNKKLHEAFKSCQNRIRSMALIHEKFYKSEDLTRIELDKYIQDLTIHLFHTYGVAPNIIRLTTEMENVHIEINRAISLGLIINELVSNSLRHAFPDGKKGEIRIKLRKSLNSKYELVIGDNGVGIPKDIDFSNTKSLGIQLVNDLVRQIAGHMDLKRDGGTSFQITF
jgi:PAS domain S-box-containing protein